MFGEFVWIGCSDCIFYKAFQLEVIQYLVILLSLIYLIAGSSMSLILSSVKAGDSGHLGFLKVGSRLLYFFNDCGLEPLGSKS